MARLPALLQSHRSGQFNDMIGEFCRLAADAEKPVLLEEFGYARSNPDQSPRPMPCGSNTLVARSQLRRAGWSGDWCRVQDSGRYPADEHEQFDAHNDGGPLWNLLNQATVRAERIRDRRTQSNSVGATP